MRVFTLRDPAFLAKTQEGGNFEVIYDPDAQAYISRLSGTYSQVELNAINNLVVSLKASNIWPTVDALYLMCMDSVEDSLLNLKSNTYTAVRVNSMGWVARQGFAGDGSTSYLNTGFSPAYAGGNYSLNSGTLAIYTPTTATVEAYDIGCRSSSTYERSFISAWWTGIASAIINSNSGSAQAAMASPAGLTSVSRTGNDVTAYRNGSSFSTLTGASSNSMSSKSIFIGGINNGSGSLAWPASTRRYPLACIAGGWDATQHSEFHSAALAALTAFGAN